MMQSSNINILLIQEFNLNLEKASYYKMIFLTILIATNKNLNAYKEVSIIINNYTIF